MPAPIRVGSLFTGWGGLDMGVAAALGHPCETVFVCDNDPDAAKVLAARYPDAPNLGDIAAVDWGAVPPVDALTGGFPCFPADTPVLTARGLTPIAEVTAGDLVLTHKNRCRPVTTTMSRQAQVVSGGGLETTWDHPFWARRPEPGRHKHGRGGVPAALKLRRPEWTAAKDLRGAHVAVPTRVPPAGPVPQVGPAGDRTGMTGGEVFWRFVGMWLGAGSALVKQPATPRPPTCPNPRPAPEPPAGRRTVYQVRVHVARDDPARAARVKATLNELGLRWAKDERPTADVYMFNHKHLGLWLTENFGHPQARRTIPAWVLSMPEPDRAALLAGYLDTDACHRPDTGGGTPAAHTVAASACLAVGARLLAESLGHTARVHISGPAPATNPDGADSQRPKLYQLDITGARDGHTARTGPHRWVEHHEPMTAGRTCTVHNLSVEQDESYVAWGLVAHNCQDLSTAGQRKGLGDGRRSGLWAHFAEAVAALRPGLVVIENVAGIRTALGEPEPARAAALGARAANLTRALDLITRKRSRAVKERNKRYADFHRRDYVRVAGLRDRALAEHRGERARLIRALGRVLADLAASGYDACWGSLEAAAIGACHKRERVFIVAWPRGEPPTRFAGAADPARDEGRFRDRDDGAAADPGGPRRDEGRPTPPDGTQSGRPHGQPRGPGALAGRVTGPAPALLPTPTAGDGDGGHTSRSGPRSNEPLLTGHAKQAERDGWGRFRPAIDWHARVLGRPDPPPSIPSPRTGGPVLSPGFSEWMMMAPEGWFTDPALGLTRSAQLRLSGNGVVPPQAAAAVAELVRRACRLAQDPPGAGKVAGTTTGREPGRGGRARPSGVPSR